ncbi:Uncharacterised protein [Legionella steigerwaltii]|uniref:Uncharacterized protein n=1 Tax=Legionella steigerwaltii TaxID=460 RepID=A0A378L9L7_9GAMM|nr:hypothetical protein [Legionella steigerwaltii]KTD80788.1 hypothetical protein Lstg_0015 [Legionella steigerwaltii]STY23526.1 Uncharacterised protein [Legionella steigerwaltii]
MAAEHREIIPSNLSKVDDLRKNISEFGIKNYKQMGRLFGVEDGQFRNIGQLEEYLKVLAADPQIKDGVDQKEIAAREFLNVQIDMLNKYKNYLLTEITRMEEERNIKKDAEVSAGQPATASKLSRSLVHITCVLDSIQHSLANTVNTINEEFEKDSKTKEARTELVTALFKVALGVVGVGAVGDVISQVLRNMHPESVDVLTGAAGEIALNEIRRELAKELAQETLDTITDEMLIHMNKVVQSTSSRISSKFQQHMTEYLSVLKNRSCGAIDKAIGNVETITLPPAEWKRELDEVNQATLLSMNPNNLDSMVIEVRSKMQLKTLQAREQAAQSEYAQLSQSIRKIIEIVGLEEGPDYQKRYDKILRPIHEYFQIHFICSVLSREYRKPSALRNGYHPAANVVQYDGYDSMIRKGQIKHFPHVLHHEPKLLMLLEPTVVTGKRQFDQAMHKGGKKLRQFLVTHISGIKGSEEIYGFKKKVKHGDTVGGIAKNRKGTIEDMLRSYAIITTLMEETAHQAGHQSSIPVFKEDKEILCVLTRLMEINAFFATHPENNGEPLVTPLCVFNRDPHFMELIKQRPSLKHLLAKLMTEDHFILKCLTDPNIKDSKADSKRLKATLDELIKLLESTKPEVDAVKVDELKEQAEHYITCQCAQASISAHIESCKQAATWILIEFNAQNEDLPKVKDFKSRSLLKKLRNHPESITYDELGKLIHELKGIKTSNIAMRGQISRWVEDFSALRREKKLVEELHTIQDTLHVGLRLSAPKSKVTIRPRSPEPDARSFSDSPINGAGANTPSPEPRVERHSKSQAANSFFNKAPPAGSPDKEAPVDELPKLPPSSNT